MTAGRADRADRDPPLFLTDDPAGRERWRHVVAAVADAVDRWAVRPGPGPDTDPETLAKLIAAVDVLPDEPVPLDAVLADLGERVLANGVRPADPACVAHLHAPPLLTAAAAELAVGATNQSLDSYDQAPAATLLEDHLVRSLARLLGLPAGASGVLTAGGTASNLLGLLLARDHATPGGWVVAADGLPPEVRDWRIVTSEAAHFSVQQAAAVLGLGHRAVVPVATDDLGRIDLPDLDRALAGMDHRRLRTIAIVGTAGTTDVGAVDPLPALADRAVAHHAWFHVDAAVGAALALSDRLRPQLAGIERADSVTADLHKLCWQPIGASVLLVRDEARLEVVRHRSDYLDRPDDEDDGLLNLVGRSLDTSRRFDALKVVLSLRATGRRRLGAMVDHLVDTAASVAERVDAAGDLELLAPPSLMMILFRWHPPGRGLDDGTLDAANVAIQRELFARGEAVLGRTRHRGRVALKLTLVNPTATADDLAAVLALVARTGAGWARSHDHSG